ncbi:3-hydroxyacyl-CoA dehydrogenase NAD-binding domain-containing protein [Sansalvadorimonas sp. 2012CJ34-2]|uniref:3-hydroxyacyl-CoA dehydrogenase NAD-binding domain-containing protein n=1 Tax=Parendozoicomonas callyspongiae TaxID=2942213 RepID=A0ABT0PHL1_9GAMM|nr:3-hydroxyacyl-CoA dehydrogenase NAD-binding domain-containing protein [Sansalvadorimonas sp. 2012CJ34-2]MCL6270872.1 3-hydroxyacyl-CoA dehydrogenase NAD-binding domain-containing protein [Sansalvadorimonas sp. 2012CJ34-2]
MTTSIRYEKDDNSIVHLIMDRQNGSANVMDEAFQNDFKLVTARLVTEAEDVKGVIFRSAKKTFFAGGDLNSIYQVTPEQGEEFFNMVETMKANMRRIETLGKPVVAAINGAALGGGWEICLMCHHRIALDDERLRVGLPEVTLGLLPGGGGVVRTVRMLGLEAAFPLLMEGKQMSPSKALKAGLISELASDADDLLAKAVAYIDANPKAAQPWDQKGYRMPGGKPSSPALAPKLSIAPAMLKDKTKGCFPAPEAIMSAAVEGAQVDFETATRIESRYFTKLVTGQVSKNMIGTFWFQLNEIKAGARRPEGIEQKPVKKVGILGAGMMGAGIAWSCASKGIDVVLKDVSQEAAEKGKAYSESLLKKRLSRGRTTPEKSEAILSRIQPTTEASDLAGCDLVIEAVFENRDLKARVTQEAEAQLESSTVFASNTSTLPITGLAQASERPDNFIGLHFFSPVDKMPLVEIICGEQTSDETLARSYDFVLQIAKTPIVVNDSRGFFTSRVFGTFLNEGVAMLGEGVPAAAIENGALLAGMPIGPLGVADEVSLELTAKIRNQTIKDMEAEGKEYTSHPAEAVIDRMLGANRAGKATGAGFYEYPQGGKKHLSPELKAMFGGEADMSLKDIKERLLFIQAVETVRCFEENVLTSVRDANIGSIFGIGFAAWSGGALQYINQYGLPAFVARAGELTEKYGERFTPPKLLVEMAEKGETFKD